MIERPNHPQEVQRLAQRRQRGPLVARHPHAGSRSAGRSVAPHQRAQSASISALIAQIVAWRLDFRLRRRGPSAAARVVEREDVLVGLVVADVDRGVAAQALALARPARSPLCGAPSGQDVDDLLAADDAHGAERRATASRIAARACRFSRERAVVDGEREASCPRSSTPGSAARRVSSSGSAALDLVASAAARRRATARCRGCRSTCCSATPCEPAARRRRWARPEMTTQG